MADPDRQQSSPPFLRRQWTGGRIAGKTLRGLALVLVLVIIFFGHRVGLPASGNDPTALLPRLGLLVMGLWWGLFSLPALHF